jgi:hypothetical protein
VGSPPWFVRKKEKQEKKQESKQVGKVSGVGKNVAPSGGHPRTRPRAVFRLLGGDPL